jgi:hypothetical protein
MAITFVNQICIKNTKLQMKYTKNLPSQGIQKYPFGMPFGMEIYETPSGNPGRDWPRP